MKMTRTLLSELEKNLHQQTLLDIYRDPKSLPYQQKRLQEAIESYEKYFGKGEVAIFSAPGRSEIGGNHTDHQKGMVLAASVNLDAIAVAGKQEKNTIEILSQGYEPAVVDLDHLEKQKGEEGISISLIRGMAYGLKQKGYSIGGFRAYIMSDVLSGAGLSSSAAYEVLIGTIISGLFNGMQIDPIVVAQVAQYAENVYFHKPCGLMDQMASSVGGLVQIDFRDIGKPIVNPVEVDFESFGYSLCIVDTGGSHADLTSEYAAIPEEMKQVARFFKKSVLRELAEEDFYHNLPLLRKELGDRPVLRAIHFFAEEKRVMAQVEALRAHRFDEFLRLVRDSGRSSFEYLQNVYTAKEGKKQKMALGLAVSEQILQNKRGVSRVHGGGFAGTLQAFVENGFVKNYCEQMDRLFGEGACRPLKIRPFGGIRIL